MNELNTPSEELAEILGLSMEVDGQGITCYRNSQGKYHRIHGPALIYADGSVAWCADGLLHRITGPAVIWADGNSNWFIDGKELSHEEFNERTRSL